MKKHLIIITDAASYGREYIAETASALKAAALFGRCTMGEKIYVYGGKTARSRIISAAAWSPELKKYYRITF